jgi:hypothetical protein
MWINFRDARHTPYCSTNNNVQFFEIDETKQKQQIYFSARRYNFILQGVIFIFLNRKKNKKNLLISQYKFKCIL